MSREDVWPVVFTMLNVLMLTGIVVVLLAFVAAVGMLTYHAYKGLQRERRRQLHREKGQQR